MAYELPLSGFWAKAGGAETVSVVRHMARTAAVMDALLHSRRRTALMDVLSAPFSGDQALASSILVGLAGLHDIGKVSPGFQGKVPEAMDANVRQVCRIDNARAFGLHHAEVSQWFAGPFLARHLGIPQLVAARLGRVVGGHHGWYPQPLVTHKSRSEKGPWQDAREQIARQMLSLSGLRPAHGPRVGAASLSSQWLLLVTGLITLADWLASSETFFPASVEGPDDGSLDASFIRDRLIARKVLSENGLDCPSLHDVNINFTHLFPAIANPNAVQQAALEAIADHPKASFVMLEVPTGTGKTEAALAVAAQWMRSHKLTGLYFCLPTQATSNQMFQRTSEYVARLLDGRMAADLHLLHSRSELSESYAELRLLAAQPESDGPVAHDWFRARKRGLLAPFGVGTIDQVLLAAMPVRHFNLRLAGLCGKVIILDEVHAYDTYTGSLLLRLLGWLSLLGCRVLLLSATLPMSTRRQLMAAWAGDETVIEKTAPYPHVTAVSRDGRSRTLTLALTPKRTLLKPLAADNWLEALVAAALAGGCVAVVCNTVRAAQETFEALRDHPALVDHDLLLLHARFPLQARIEREDEVLARFGKGASDSRRRNAVLVATQVIEQSLDLDFDVLFTELAPIDLMIQRMGRLHRHDGRSRPDGHAIPICYWKTPAISDGIPEFGPSGYVYAPLVLMRSWLSIRERSDFNSPDEMQPLIEAVYGETTIPGITDVESLLLDRLSREYQASQRAQETEAEQWVLPLPSQDTVTDFLSGGVEEADDSSAATNALHVQTRLTPPSVQLVVCLSDDGCLWRLYEGHPLDVEAPPDTVAFRRAILLSGLSIADPRWVKAFRQTGRPAAWNRHRLLRNVYPAYFCKGELVAPSPQLSGVRLHLSPPLGLVSGNTMEDQ